MEEDNQILDDKDIEDLIFDKITDEQAINSHDGGDSDAEDILPVNLSAASSPKTRSENSNMGLSSRPSTSSSCGGSVISPQLSTKLQCLILPVPSSSVARHSSVNLRPKRLREDATFRPSSI